MEKNLIKETTKIQGQIDTSADSNNDWQILLYKLSLARAERDGMLVELEENC